MKVTTVQEMRNLDRTAIESYGIPDQILMENAGQAALLRAAHRASAFGAEPFSSSAGVGNNGGDGFVVARKILSSGGRAKIFCPGRPTGLWRSRPHEPGYPAAELEPISSTWNPLKRPGRTWCTATG